jgi:hypothetical protein
MLIRTCAIALALLIAASGAGAAGYRAPRAADGHADLGGLWSSTSLTELERPARFKTLTIPDAEALAYERRRPEDFSTTDIDEVGGRQSEASFWDLGARLARIGGQARTSWIVEPADGRLPFSKAGLAQRAPRPGGRRPGQPGKPSLLRALPCRRLGGGGSADAEQPLRQRIPVRADQGRRRHPHGVRP